MSKKFEKLKTLLKELFQLDQPDLDFGLYRIMHAKSAEITQFLDRDLLPQVREEFAQYKTADKSDLEAQLAKVIAGLQAAEVDPETSPKVRELREKIASDSVDLAGLESEVYDHLYGFFRRYYSEGDFLSKRVYKPGVYAIPYEGEEVKLHWANADQYYIKTSEYLRDYAFRLHPDDEQKPMRVHFRLVDAAEGEHGNVKAAEGKDRIFILASKDFAAIEPGEQGSELAFQFEYRPATLTDWPDDIRDGKKKPPTQKDMTELAESRIMAGGGELASWITELGKPHEKVDGELADYSRLRAHLNRYVARNTFDYFIHKDLGTFLRRELDFYIKNEVMHLDDIEGQQAPRVEQYLSKVRVIRRIATKIITFLAHLEDFQKKLWLKKKFVTEKTYYFTLGMIPESFFAEIADNSLQREEWKKLFAIDDIRKDLAGTVSYSEPLSIEFLRNNPSLPVNCGLFSARFTNELLNHFQDLDSVVSGYLIHADNFQALNLIGLRMKHEVDLIYIDPPYNTGQDDFRYKDNYQHSSWLSLIQDRVRSALTHLKPGGVLCCSLNDDETFRAGVLFDLFSPRLTRLGEFVWRTRNTDNRVTSRLSVDHEYIHVFAQRGASIEGRVIDRSDFKNPDNDSRGPYTTDPLTGKANAQDRPNLHYLIVNPETGDEYPPDPDFGWITDREGFNALLAEKRVHWPANPKSGKPRKKRFLFEASERAPVSSLEISIKQGEGNRDLSSLFGEKLLNFPKPVSVIQTVVDTCSSATGFVLDFFAGSGTTGEAVLRLNRSEDCSRRFCLIDVSEYFDELCVPRVLKTVGANEWDAGKPVKRDGTAKAAFVVIRLESYEDAINNLQLRRTKAQQTLLDSAQSTEASRLKEQYMLGYMLNVEAEGSQSLLNVQAFADPTSYKLKVKRPGSDETREVNVDLLETFNWLIGLTVQHIAAPQRFSAKFERDGEGRLRLKGRLKQDDEGGYWFRTVTGTTADGRKTLVIWRKRPGGETHEGVEQDNLVLDEWFTKQGYSSKDSEFGLIYVNGTNNLENLRTPEDLWKVRLIEEDFHRLMFAAEGV